MTAQVLQLPQTEQAIRTLIERQGWGWSVERIRPAYGYSAFVHTHDLDADRSCFLADGDTPEQALAEAYAQATREQLQTLGINSSTKEA